MALAAKRGIEATLSLERPTQPVTSANVVMKTVKPLPASLWLAHLCHVPGIVNHISAILVHPKESWKQVGSTLVKKQGGARIQAKESRHMGQEDLGQSVQSLIFLMFT